MIKGTNHGNSHMDLSFPSLPLPCEIIELHANHIQFCFIMDDGENKYRSLVNLEDLNIALNQMGYKIEKL